MLEEVAERLIAALEAVNKSLIAYNNSTGAVAVPNGKAAAAPAKATKAAPAKEDKVSYEMVKAALIGVKDAKGKPAAVKIIREVGAAADMAAIKPARYTSVIAACDEVMSEEEEEEEAEEDEI